MKKLWILGALGLSMAAQAHDLWVSAPVRLDSGGTLKADLGYSHDFPNVEKIADDPRAYFQTAAIDGQIRENR